MVVASVAGTWVTFGSQISDKVSGTRAASILSGSVFSSSRPQRASLQVAEDVMTVAYDSGINLFDTAEVYSAGK